MKNENETGNSKETMQYLYLEAKRKYTEANSKSSENQDKNNIVISDGIDELRDRVDKLRVGLLINGVPIPEDKDYEYLAQIFMKRRTEIKSTREECNYVFDHIEGDYEIWRCTECGHEKRVPIQKDRIDEVQAIQPYKEGEPHTYVEQKPEIENMTDEGYEVVVYQVCTECGDKRVISREIVDHPYVGEDTMANMMSSLDEDEVVYEICTEKQSRRGL